jgi:hypothetical protein
MFAATTTKALADVLKDANTGDILIFQGRSTNPIDYCIQLEEGEPYTHSGMIVRQGNDLVFWDAPGEVDKLPDVFNGGAMPTGCRGAKLNDLLVEYMSVEIGLFYRKLNSVPTPDQISALNVFIKSADGTPFPMQTPPLPDNLNLGFGLIASYALGRKHLTHAGSYYCAQLVVDSYIHMGMVNNREFPANAYSPADLAANGVPFNPGYSLGPLIVLEAPSSASVSQPGATATA